MAGQGLVLTFQTHVVLGTVARVHDSCLDATRRRVSVNTDNYGRRSWKDAHL